MFLHLNPELFCCYIAKLQLWFAEQRRKITSANFSSFIFHILVSAMAVSRILSRVFPKDLGTIFIIDFFFFFEICKKTRLLTRLSGTSQDYIFQYYSWKNEKHHEKVLEIYENFFHVLQDYSLLQFSVKLDKQWNMIGVL